jgi:hypothetical protein
MTPVQDAAATTSRKEKGNGVRGYYNFFNGSGG